MNECIFCKIAKKEIKGNIVYEDNDVLAFKDLNPQAPVHILIIPKKHIETLNELQDEKLAGHLLTVSISIAKQNNLQDKGYRIVINCQKDAGQAVFHIHYHLLGGRKFNWPPG